MKIIKKNLKVITILFVMIIIIGGILIKFYLETNKKEFVAEEDIVVEVTENKTIANEEESLGVINKVFVDIKGAVKTPGVYEIDENKKVIDVVNLAGGFTKNADTSMINLAKKVSNEMVIIIYTVEEVKKSKETETVVKIIEKECVCPEIKNDACLEKNNTNTKEENKIEEEVSKNEKININKANIEDLQKISGIGESKAKSIIEYREKNGEFKSIEDIKNVSGIGEALYEKIKDSITI